MVFMIFKYNWNVCLCLWLKKLINSRILCFDTLVVLVMGIESRKRKWNILWNIVEHFFFYV